MALILGLALLIIPFLLIAALNSAANARMQAVGAVEYFEKDGIRYPAKTVVIMCDQFGKNIEAVFMRYETKNDKYVLEPIIGNQYIECSSNEFFDRLVKVTNRTCTIDIQEKSYYNFYMYECPMCKSRKVKKISTERKAGSILVSGLASSNIGRNYQCDDCKYKW